MKQIGGKNLKQSAKIYIPPNYDHHDYYDVEGKRYFISNDTQISPRYMLPKY